MHVFFAAMHSYGCFAEHALRQRSIVEEQQTMVKRIDEVTSRPGAFDVLMLITTVA